MLSACIGRLLELAEADKNVLYLTADSGEGGLDAIFRRNFPDRCYDFGIAEGNMVAAAAGLAASGKIPFVFAPTPFLVYRAYEFLRNDICLQNYSVKLIGTGSGLSVSALGPTHHATEDLGALRSLPNLRILSPATPIQAGACVADAYKTSGPAIIRVGMTQREEVFTEDYALPAEGLELLKQGKDGLILSTGSIALEALRAADLLHDEGFDLSVADVAVLKPVDVKIFRQLLKDVKHVITVEEHNIIGGLGSLLAETIATERLGAILTRIGLKDRFSEGYGTLEQIREQNGLDAQSIAQQIRVVMK